MKIINLIDLSTIYTSNVFYVSCSPNSTKDVNTLIDVGRESSIIEKIYNLSPNDAQNKVDQVILTHSHYDHTGLLEVIKEVYQPVVYAYSNIIPGINHLLQDGEQLVIGDQMAEIIHCPGHSDDSICIYCQVDKALFAGDNPLLIDSTAYSFEHNFIEALEKICDKDINSIYFGHGASVTKCCNEKLNYSLKLVKRSSNNKIVTFCNT